MLIKMSSLQDLSSELFRTILQLCDTSYFAILQLNRYMKQSVLPYFYGKYHNMKISNKEIEEEFTNNRCFKFKETISRKGTGIYTYSERAITIITLNNMIKCRTSGKDCSSLLTVTQPKRDKNICIDKNYDLDPISKYKILRKRLACTEYNPEYAKKKFS